MLTTVPEAPASCAVLDLEEQGHREGHKEPAPLAANERYRVRIKLNDAGSVFPAGHKV
jgi:uncharacterized protein